MKLFQVNQKTTLGDDEIEERMYVAADDIKDVVQEYPEADGIKLKYRHIDVLIKNVSL